MAEIGIIASIIQVAGAGFRLSIVLNAVGCELANAGLEVHSISRGVTLFSLMLKQVGIMLQAADSVHSREAVEATQQISEECTLVFEAIEEMLDKCRTRKRDGSYSPTIQQRFKWCFKKHKVTYLLTQLESLKLSLSVMLQILQLGKLMASTSKSDAPEEVTVNKKAIEEERYGTQNVVIVRYWEVNKLEGLYEAAKREETEEKQGEIEHHQDNQALLTDGTVQLAIEPPPDYSSSTTLTKLPLAAFKELDQMIPQTNLSPLDVFRMSAKVIDPLLQRWTHWHEIRERRHARDSGSVGRFAPTVQSLDEEDEEGKPKSQSLLEREESLRGYYLEGPTTDWRQPHSVAARQDAHRRRRKYKGYQPSVSAESSDLEDSPGSKGSQKRSPRRFVIDSGSESSDSEPQHPRPRRRSSGSPTKEKKTRFSDGTTPAQPHGPGQPIPGGTRFTTSPGTTPLSTPRPSLSHSYTPMNQRPLPNPNQNPHQHSISTPLPQIHTTQQYMPPTPYSPTTPDGPQYMNANHNFAPYPLDGPQYMGANPNLAAYPPVPRYMPPPHPGWMQMPPRPGSQDGKTRSPSRLPHHSSGSRGPGKTGPSREEERRATRDKAKKNWLEGATKGVLSAGAIATVLEALEGL